MTMLNTAILRDMLSYRRPHGTKTERKFIARFIDSVPGMTKDAFGNRILRVGSSSTMISCHVDTVHTDGGIQNIIVSDKGRVELANPVVRSWRGGKLTGPYRRDCLGADDGAGMFVALSLIAAKRPGLYVFHRGEEVGGLGSTWASTNSLELFKGIERCIAFDRRGESDIITHQMMGRCCSDEFAVSLGNLLGMGHSPCAFGTFTDTANYTDLVGECTNVAVGYEHEHSTRESLETNYLYELIETLCTLDLDSLPCVRVRGEVEDYRQSYASKSRTGFLSYHSREDEWPLHSIDSRFCVDHGAWDCIVCSAAVLTGEYDDEDLSDCLDSDDPNFLECLRNAGPHEHCTDWYAGNPCCVCDYEGNSPICS